MTVGELILLRTLREAFDLPVEIVKMIIRNLNLRGRVQYNRRRRLPRFFNELEHIWHIGTEPRITTPYYQTDSQILQSAAQQAGPGKRFFGPGF